MRKVTTRKGVELWVPEKGEKHAGAGRPRGSKNKITLTLKEALLVALEAVGEDGKSTNGLTGYLFKVAMKRPDLIMPILGKLMLLEMKQAAKAEKKRTYTKIGPAMPPKYETLEDIRAKAVALIEQIDRVIATRSSKPVKQDATKQHGLQ
ncbi:MAG: hypothetical protein E7813_20680 [Bradyrhizobium sp.]|uniref:hypothetical protein n=1 Tax=Bradyrhizobium sp. TaxID=376 RepID=UPI0012277F90|nr:hypothetical protein [Bradyrhizobium sp.]THD62123.1 MAG: hypothetical protein E7813_20680 [Bradyrhizobium sp.]